MSAIQSLGWRAEVPIEHTVARYLDWIRTFSNTRQYLEAAEAAMRWRDVIRRVAAP